jgi:hypothetical protein
MRIWAVIKTYKVGYVTGALAIAYFAWLGGIPQAAAITFLLVLNTIVLVIVLARSEVDWASTMTSLSFDAEVLVRSRVGSPVYGGVVSGPYAECYMQAAQAAAGEWALHLRPANKIHQEFLLVTASSADLVRLTRNGTVGTFVDERVADAIRRQYFARGRRVRPKVGDISMLES